MDRQVSAVRTSTLRRVGWVTVAAMLSLALLAPGAAATLGVQDSFTGAIWTSLANGTTVNANVYQHKNDVFLNGGPQNCGTGSGLPDGDYYFQVTDPSGLTLLSSDATSARQVRVTNGVIAGNGNGTHSEGSASCSGGLPVRLAPFDTTPNSGAEYSVDLGAKADVEDCPGFAPDSRTLNFLDCAQTKNDSYKVRFDRPAIALAKVADPTIVPAAGGDVTYTYTVTNPGEVGITKINLVDDKCDSPAYVSGDVDGNARLDRDETWIYTCTTFITVPTVNTAIVDGWGEGVHVTDQAQALVDLATETSTTTTSESTSTTETSSSSTSTSSSQSLQGETDVPTPNMTLPPTETPAGPLGPSNDSWRMLLIVAAGLLAVVLFVLLSPARASRRP
jgi:hypothetical protein